MTTATEMHPLRGRLLLLSAILLAFAASPILAGESEVDPGATGGPAASPAAPTPSGSS